MIADGERDSSLDFVKGILVVLMLTFHAGGLFIADRQALWLLDEVVLNFVSGSWVFLSGYLVVLRYGSRAQSDLAKVRSRLMIRGMKIIGLYTLLNVVIGGLGLRHRSIVDYNMWTIGEILFNGGGERASFGVLLGIGYLLLFSPFLLLLQRKTGAFTWLVVIATIIVSLPGVSVAPNLWLILCGLVGMALGFWFNEGRIAEGARRSLGPPLLLAFCLAGAAIHYTLFFLWAVTRDNLLVYLLGVVSVVTLIFISHRWRQPPSHVDEGIRLLGRYSLVCYVLQMGILWGLWWLASSIAMPFSFVFASAASLAILLLIIWLIERLICAHQTFKKMYSYAFQ
jgi:hypothetical protein